MQNIQISMDDFKAWADNVSDYLQNAPVDEQAAWGCIGAGILLMLISIFF